MITVSWADVMHKTLILAKMLESKKVYGIPRGGTLLACLLSYRGCELITTPPVWVHEEVTIVDDIADTGKTLGVWQKKGFMTAALYVRHSCAPLPNYLGTIINVGDYVAFPYENPDEAKR